MIYLVTGGTRSGKSSYAEERALQLSKNPVYVATARVWDDDFQNRVDRHRQDRSDAWTTIEEQLYLSQLDLQGKVAVIDCVTLWLTNFFQKTKQNVDKSLKLMQQEIDALTKLESTLIFVTNEIGMGMHAPTEMGRKFADLQGWANQYIAAKAQKVILMVSGIPVMIKK